MASTAAANQPKIKLYWLEQSRSQRILWLLEELKLPYELEIFHRNKETHLAPPELKEVHALGKSPVITIQGPGSTETITVAESGFITEYLLDHFANGTTLLPKRYKEGQEGQVAGETEEWMRYKYYMHFAEGTLMAYLILALVSGQIKSAPVPFFIKPITNGVASKLDDSFINPNLKNLFGFLESQLASAPGGGPYLCGTHLTGADILMSFPLVAGRKRAGVTKESYPKVTAYTEMLEKEPGYVKGAKKIEEIDGKFEASLG